MSNAPVTASGLERALHCPASCVLARVDATGDDAEDGHERHAHSRRLIGGMSAAASLALVPVSLQKQCEAVRTEDLVGDLSTEVRSEVSYGYNVDTLEARELGVGLGRKYPDLGPRWLVGTLDIEGVTLDGTRIVKDLKSGYLDVTPAAGNLQLKFFALSFASLHPEPIEGAILRMRGDGTTEAESRAAYGAYDLDEAGDTMLEIVDGIARVKAAYGTGAPLDVHEGEWCRYCPGFNACPAKVSLARTLLEDGLALEKEVAGAELSVADAARAWVRVRKAKPVYERIEKVLKERACREPLPLGEGKELHEIAFSRTDFSDAAAVVLLRAKGASEAELSALRVEKMVRQVREGNPETKSAQRAKATKKKAPSDDVTEKLEASVAASVATGVAASLARPETSVPDSAGVVGQGRTGPGLAPVARAESAAEEVLAYCPSCGVMHGPPLHVNATATRAEKGVGQAEPANGVENRVCPYCSKEVPPNTGRPIWGRGVRQWKHEDCFSLAGRVDLPRDPKPENLSLYDDQPLP